MTKSHLQKEPSVESSNPTNNSSTGCADSTTGNKVTILGFGSLLSKTSAQTTFPNLSNFRLGKVHNYKRVFGHPASIFFQRNIVNYDTLEMSSLCAEYCLGASFVCSVFEVSNENNEFMEINQKEHIDGDDDNDNQFVPSMAFREREEEFDIQMIPYEELNNPITNDDVKRVGILCCRSTDENYIKLWGQARFDENYKKYNIDTIWNWKIDSDLKPCGPYLRHCVLAAKNMGEECYDSFLDDTFLVDRKTTIRSYLDQNPHVMETLPPPELQKRYGG